MISAFAQGMAETIRNDCHCGEGLVVVHTRRPQNSDGTSGLAIDNVRRYNNRTIGEGFVARLSTDRNRKSTVKYVFEETDYDELLLENSKDLADGSNGVERRRHIGCAPNEDLVIMAMATAQFDERCSDNERNIFGLTKNCGIQIKRGNSSESLTNNE
jgi:hypothetical protein